MTRCALSALVAALGCAAGCQAERPPRPEHAAESPPARVVAPVAPVVTDARPKQPPASESAARLVLSRRFRAAGFRVLQDVRVVAGDTELTCDGYDPARKVGFEYIAVEERDTDVSRAEKAALAAQSEYRLLVVEAAPVSEVDVAARRFLRRVKPSSASDPQ